MRRQSSRPIPLFAPVTSTRRTVETLFSFIALEAVPLSDALVPLSGALVRAPLSDALEAASELALPMMTRDGQCSAVCRRTRSAGSAVQSATTARKRPSADA